MKQHEQWLKQVLDLITVGRDDAEAYLRPLLKRCHAKSRKTFVTWAQMMLSRSGLSLSPVSELRLLPEIVTPHQREGFRHTVYGSTAFIEVVDGSDVAIWKIPAAKLNWAISLYPVYLKRLPDLEPSEIAEGRRLQARLKRESWHLTPKHKQMIADQILELAKRARRTFGPIPRFMLAKYQGGERQEVHRLFVGAIQGEVVEPLDGDYLNFCDLTFKVTMKPVIEEGHTVAKGDKPPRKDEEEEGEIIYERETVTVPNLHVVHSDQSQMKFDMSQLQYKLTAQGDINVSENPQKPVGASIPEN